MQQLQYLIPRDFDGHTVAQFLRSEVKLSTGLLRQLKRTEQGIQCNGHPIRSVDRLAAGDCLELRLEGRQVPVEAVPLPLSRIYEDEHILVVDKSPHMPVHPTHNHQGDTLANAAAYHWQAQGAPYAFHPINRLDRDTSGLVLIARNRYVASRLTGHVEKAYTAIVSGHLAGCGCIDAPICRPRENCTRRAVGEGGQRAVTHWEAVCAAPAATQVNVRLETGRTHQIRVHFAHIGHALLGDTYYGEESAHIGRQALHCSRLCFVHPVTEEALDLRIPLPEDMAQLMRRFIPNDNAAGCGQHYK